MDLPGLDLASWMGLVALAVLGLRHGLDPDHIAAVDGMTFQALRERPSLAPWVGTLFACGHGLVVTAVAVGVGALGAAFQPPAPVLAVLEWGPVALLLLVGTLNLVALLREDAYQPVSWKRAVLPSWARETSHPLGVIAVGAVFGLVFDTATQAAAWGYAASSHGGVGAALAVALAFTVGMVLTDALDGHLMCHFLKDAGVARRYRRGVGWFTVATAYGMALYALMIHFRPGAALAEWGFTAVGATLVAFIVMACLMALVMRPVPQR